MHRCFALTTLVAAAPLTIAQAQAPLVLDRDTVAALAREHAPVVAVAEARTEEARALHVGTRLGAPANPELGLSGGARFFDANNVTPEAVVTLAWPIDFGGVGDARERVASARTTVAEEDADETRRTAVGEALDLWVRAVGADQRAQLERDRAAIDEAVLNAARARSAAGTTGDGDVALATVVAAQGAARARTAEADRDALLVLLCARLGLRPLAPVTLAGSLDVADPPPLAALLALLPHRTDVVRATDTIAAERTDADLRRRVGVPVPRLTFVGAHDPEYALRGGVDVPLPIYEQNQTNVAIAIARGHTASVERTAALATATGELRAAYASFVGARAALATLEGANGAIDDAEHLATRAYELGADPLGTLLVARREVASARSALLDARVAAARARLAVDVAAGVVPWATRAAGASAPAREVDR